MHRHLAVYGAEMVFRRERGDPDLVGVDPEPMRDPLAGKFTFGDDAGRFTQSFPRRQAQLKSAAFREVLRVLHVADIVHGDNDRHRAAQRSGVLHVK